LVCIVTMSFTGVLVHTTICLQWTFGPRSVPTVAFSPPLKSLARVPVKILAPSRWMIRASAARYLSGMELPLLREAQRRPGVEVLDRSTPDEFDSAQACAMRRMPLVLELVLIVAVEEVTIDGREIAVDAFAGTMCSM
jgi:hypothetical protein